MTGRTEKRAHPGVTLLKPKKKKKKGRRLPPVRCASAGAERREGGLCADPAYVVIPQEKREKKGVMRVRIL
jgi:hypothetical protein